MIQLAVALVCSIAINSGVVTGTCDGAAPPPTPIPAPPTPTPPPAPVPPAGVVMGVVGLGGHNNFVVDSSDAIHSFQIPTDWSARFLGGMGFYFASQPPWIQPPTGFDITISQAPGDMSPQPPCGVHGAGNTVQLFMSPTGSFQACKTDPSVQWYINWQAKSCPGTCGQTFTAQ